MMNDVYDGWTNHGGIVKTDALDGNCLGCMSIINKLYSSLHLQAWLSVVVPRNTQRQHKRIFALCDGWTGGGRRGRREEGQGYT